MVKGVPFVKDGVTEEGADFFKMIKMPENSNTLFIFNDNVEDSRVVDNELVPGSGSAVIRPWSKQATNYQAMGIPTGWMKGVPFDALDVQVRQCINASVERIRCVVIEAGYERILFSCDPSDVTSIGTSTFSVPAPIISYINKCLAQLEHHIRNKPNHLTMSQIKWSMIWVDYRLDEERRKRNQRFAMQQSAFGSAYMTSPTGLVKRARTAGSSSSGSGGQISISRFF